MATDTARIAGYHAHLYYEPTTKPLGDTAAGGSSSGSQ
jgi:aromatic ring-cleaving dioxygenase